MTYDNRNPQSECHDDETRSIAGGRVSWTHTAGLMDKQVPSGKEVSPIMTPPLGAIRGKPTAVNIRIS